METLLVAMLVAGFASGVHCAGMCGGFAAAFAAAHSVQLHPARRGRWHEFGRQFLLSAGRITSYTVAGAIAGLAGGAGAWIAGAAPVQAALFLLANVALILAALYIAGARAWLARIETIGAPLWRLLQPHAARLAGARTLPKVYAAGMLWGWLPCGLVYGALAAAALAGSPARGAATMLAFGLGTLPNLLLIGVAAARVRAWSGNRIARLASAALLLGFGTYGLARAGSIGDTLAKWYCL
ncbi:MAG TPA: sulfite exporter TauE/SafE family protein [Burkholderiales bacterium]|nr:sulfite exporter TauE/SafE family protein [Burkholderiales bacterium]